MKIDSNNFMQRLFISVLITPIILVLFPLLVVVGIIIYLFNLPVPKTKNEKLIIKSAKECLHKIDCLTTNMENVFAHSIVLGSIEDKLNFLRTNLLTIIKLIQYEK